MISIQSARPLDVQPNVCIVGRMFGTKPLTRAEYSLFKLLERMPESVAIYDLDGCVLYVNPTTERIFGKSIAEMEGRCLWELFPGAVGNAFHQAFQRVADGGAAAVFEHYYPPFDRWFDNRIERVDGVIHVVARDITEDVQRRRRLEAVARISAVLTDDALDLQGASQAVAAILSEILGADCSLALLSQDKAWLEIVSRASGDAASLDITSAVTRFRADAGHPGKALRTRSTILAEPEAVAEEARKADDPTLKAVLERYRPLSVLVTPLIAGEEPIGVVTAVRRQGQQPLGSSDRTVVAEIGPSIALYLAHARRRAEAASLRSRLEAVMDSSPALVSFVDRDERYQYVNASCERWFARSRDSVIGRTIAEVVGESAYEAIAAKVRAALAGQAVQHRSLLAYPSGERHVVAHYQPVEGADRRVEGFAATVVDVTAEVRLAEYERHRAEAERQATGRLQSLLAVTGKLAGAATADEIARVVVDGGAEALGADLGGLWLLSPDGGELILQRERGFNDRYRAAFATIPLDTPGPLSDCVSSGEPVWIESRVEYSARYPVLEEQYRPSTAPPISFALLPIMIEGRAQGCLNFTFHDERRLTTDERTYLEVLVLHAAEALRRAWLYAELRDVSETRQAMIQASPAAIMLFDRDGSVEAWNPAAERIFGWKAADVIGKFFPAVDEEQKAGFMASLDHVLRGNVVEGQVTTLLRKPGDLFDVELYAAPVKLSDGIERCLSMVFDVSERTRIERGRRLAQDASALLGRSLDWGHTIAALIRLPLAGFADGCELKLLPSEDEASEWAAGVSAADESVRSRLSTAIVVGAEQLGAFTVVSTTRDFDDLDRSILNELSSYVAASIEKARLFRETVRARRDAEAASRAKDQFLAILGHELRNPLAPIATALHLMRLRAPEQLERERAVIERQVSHLSRLVDDLLDVSRITRGKVELRREPTALGTVLAKAIEIASPLLEQRRHKLTVDVPPDLTVEGDSVRLGQVFANLLSNAAKYTEAEGAILVTAAREGNDAVVRVRDNGVGIAPEMLPVIFEMFVQAPQPSARSDGGLGLGLTIVRSLVEMHGGQVVAHSDGLGKGSEFVVSLPAMRELKLVSSPSTRSQLRAKVNSRKVLVVDDNQDAADLLSEYLSGEGHEVRVAFDGPSALRVAQEFHPEVAVLDIGLPVMDGYELGQRLRTSARPPRALIAVTGYGQESDRARSAAAGFAGHLAKPVSVEELARLVERS